MNASRNAPLNTVLQTCARLLNTMANTQRGNPIFAVRLPAETQAVIREAAKQNGLGVAEWVANAVRMALDNPQAIRGSTPGAVDRQTYQDDLAAITARIEALEAAMVKRPKANAKPKAQVTTVTDAPTEKLVSTQGGRREPLSADRKARILDLLNQGMGPTQIARTVGVDKSTVSRLGKTVLVRQRG
jgi:DNA-binding NarL/FixJ family response regulator